MSFKEQVEKKVEAMMQSIVVENQFELVDVEYVKEAGTWYLRIYLDKEGGFTVNDCELVSKALDVKLEAADPIRDPYILEVSSPGLDRPLKKENDFRRSVGKPVDLKLYKAQNNNKEFQGILVSYDADTVTLNIEETVVAFNRKDIAIIRLAVIF